MLYNGPRKHLLDDSSKHGLAGARKTSEFQRRDFRNLNEIRKEIRRARHSAQAIKDRLTLQSQQHFNTLPLIIKYMDLKLV